ncbi:MAG: cell division protein FtsQ/DivIB [Bacillota bacterium]
MRNNRETPTEYGRNGYPGEPVPQPDLPYAETAYAPGIARRSNKGINRLIVFTVVIIIALTLLQTVVFRLQTVYVIGNHTRTAGHIASLSGIEKGDNIFAVSEDKVRDSLETDHWMILKHLYKQYPGEVYLFVDEREIVATMQWLGIQYMLDIDGMVLEEYSGVSYGGKVPTVYGFNVSNAIVGDFLSVRLKSQLIAYSSIVSELTIQQFNEQVESINVTDPDQLTLLTADGITVQLGNGDYMRAKVGALRTYIAYLQQLGETNGVLDVTVPEDGKFRRE